MFNEYVLLVLTYGTEIWVFNTITTETIAVAQRNLERIVLGITLSDRKTNTWIRQKIGVKDRFDPIKKGKHR